MNKANNFGIEAPFSKFVVVNKNEQNKIIGGTELPYRIRTNNPIKPFEN